MSSSRWVLYCAVAITAPWIAFAFIGPRGYWWWTFPLAISFGLIAGKVVGEGWHGTD